MRNTTWDVTSHVDKFTKGRLNETFPQRKHLHRFFVKVHGEGPGERSPQENRLLLFQGAMYDTLDIRWLNPGMILWQTLRLPRRWHQPPSALKGPQNRGVNFRLKTIECSLNLKNLGRDNDKLIHITRNNLAMPLMIGLELLARLVKALEA